MSQDDPTTPRRLSKASKWVIGLSCANLLMLCLVSYLLYSVSESWWIGIVLTYAPRTPFLIPAIVLTVASVFWSREALGINLVAIAIVAVPIMGLSIPLERWLDRTAMASDERSLRILSCNVQAFKPDFDKVLAEIQAFDPDVIVLQEAFRGDPRMDEYFRDWQEIRHGHFWIGSRFPITLVSDCHVTTFGGRLAGMLVQVNAPGGPILVGNVHLMTPRFGLVDLSKKSLLTGEGTKELESFEGERYVESIEIRSKIDSARENRPLIVCGDFNTPVSSSLFRKQFGDLQSAFDAAAFGYGYTSPCKGNRYWPDNTPWARIDHILCSKEWTVRECQIGKSAGSDHRLIAATVVQKAGNR